MHSETQIESQLLKAMRRIAAPYRKAIEILRESSTHDASVCTRLRPAMEMIEDQEMSLAPLRTQSNSLDRPPSEELKRTIEEQSVLLQELIERITSVEIQFVSSRGDLAQRLDMSNRQTAMRQAYQPTPGGN